MAKWVGGPSMTTGRQSFGLAALGTKLYAVGGFACGQLLSSVEVFDAAAGEWVPGPPLAAARIGLGLATLDGKLYAVGGFNGTRSFSSVEVLTPAAGKWVAGPSLADARYAFGLAAVGTKQLYAVGGQDGLAQRGQYLSSVEVHHVELA